jgi:predicted GH43/DUF377 family glycosyl hydrolase
MKLWPIPLLLLPALMLLVACGGGSQIADTPTSLPIATFTPAPPTASLVATRTSTPTPIPASTTTATPTTTSTPNIVGTVRFQVDVQQVTTTEQLGQASIVGPSLIHLEDGRIRLYLQARANRDDSNFNGVNIVSLISSDGTQWDVEPGIRISHGSESDIDSEAGEPAVYLGLDDKYHMAYTGRFMGVNRKGEDQLMHRVGFAVSDDGLAWTKLNQYYHDPKNKHKFASSADVTIVNGEYVIYYTGSGSLQNQSKAQIIRASSQESEDGLKWVRQEIAFSAGHDSTMVKVGSTYYMFVMMPEALEYASDSDRKKDLLTMAVSNDGVHWSKHYYRVVVEHADGSKVDTQNIQDPGAILLPDGSLRIFLNDFGGKNIFSIKPVAPLPKLTP